MRYLSCDLQYLWYWKINRLRKLAPEPCRNGAVHCTGNHEWNVWAMLSLQRWNRKEKPFVKVITANDERMLHCIAAHGQLRRTKNLCTIHAKHLYNKYQPKYATKKSWPKARIHAHSCKKIPFPSLAGLTVIAKQAVLLAPDHRSTTPSQIAPVT